MTVTILHYYSSIITIIVKNDNILCFNYTIKTEKFLVVAFIVGTIFFACCTAMSLREKEDMFVICIFGIFFLVGISGIVNMVMWKLEVNGDEITWRSTFGRKRTFHFEDITYCERKKGSMRVYVNGEKLFTIDSNIFFSASSSCLIN